MAYLIDTNCFIEPKNRYYSFDICPGFWDWLDQQNQLGIIYSIDNVSQELTVQNDDLAKWAKQKGASFFLPLDNAAFSSMTQIATWVVGPSEGFTSQAIREFLGGADPFLIAYALAHGDTVVTHEVHRANQISKIKIPTVCQHFNVPCATIFDVLRATGAKLVL